MTVRFTKEGYEKLKKEYEVLLQTRPEAVEHLKKSREMGDLSENGYYKSSRAKLSFLDRQLREMKAALAEGIVVKADTTDKVTIGSVVKLQNESVKVTYEIVGDMEARPSIGKISLLSPLGKALSGKRQNDVVTIETLVGRQVYKILSVGK